jgi:SNF2 family DNA or RNA helicase
MITKTGAYTLQEHQSRVLEALKDNPGVVVAHSPGSGKTLTSLAAAEQYLREHKGKRALYVVPASLVTNIQKEMDKHQINLPKDRLDVVSYDKATRGLNRDDYGFVVADEAHKLRNTGTKRYQTLRNLVAKADKRLLLTGTVDYNRLSDIAPVVNMAANDVSKNIIKFSQPEQKKLFSMMQQSNNKFIMLNGTPVKLAEYVGDESGKIFLSVTIAVINVLFFSTIH